MEQEIQENVRYAIKMKVRPGCKSVKSLLWAAKKHTDEEGD